jgi:tetratricopeptide (TPR) repeat protein
MQTGGYQLIALRDAVTRITNSVKQRGRGERYPYFFIAGSGVSLPAMPTTKRIIEDCKQKLKMHAADETMGIPESYAHWLEMAHSEPIDRQKYFASLVRKAKVNAASLFLAQLLVGSDIARIVVTTNFDDLLRRALRLFGASPRILDYPDSVSRLDLQSDEIQIAHVHGSHHYYDLKNLEVELESLKKPEPDGPAKIVQQLESLLELSSPIVIGYGGWPKDVVMTALRLHLKKGTMRRNLYWFLYDKHELPSLPEWLRHDPRVYFVVADSQRATPSAPSVSSVSETDAPGGTLSTDPILETLDGGRVLHELVIALKVAVPRIIDNPIGHFAKHIEMNVGTDIDQYENYRFRDVVKRMRYVEMLEQRYPQQNDPLVRVAKFAREGNIGELVKQVHAVDYHNPHVSVAQYEETIAALEVALDTVQIDADLKFRGLSLLLTMLLEYSRKRSPQGSKTEMAPRQQASKAMKVAKEIEELGKFEAAAHAYEAVIEAFPRSSTTKLVLAYVVEAHERRALVLSRRLQRHEDAVALLEAFIAGSEFFEGTDIREGWHLRDEVLALRFAYSEVLIRAKRDPLPVLERIIAVYTEIVTRAREDESAVSFVTPSVRAVAEALIRKGVYLWSREKPDTAGAIEAYETVIRYAASRPFIARHAARAFRDLAFINSTLGKHGDVARIAGEGIAYLNATRSLRPAHDVQYRIQLTYLKANALAAKGEVDDAVPLYVEIASQPTLAAMPGEEYGSSVARLVEYGLNVDDKTLPNQYVHALEAVIKAAGTKAPDWWQHVFARAEEFFLGTQL